MIHHNEHTADIPFVPLEIEDSIKDCLEIENGPFS